MKKIILLSLTFLLFSVTVHAERIKDLSSIAGIRVNQLVGYGLVVGLDGTGDSGDFTNQSFKTMLSRLGVRLPDDVTASSKNIAAVAIHAELPPFAQPGQNIDVTVSSIGSAKSLRGGTLLVTPLKALDDNTYAVAQGNLIVGGFGIEGNDGSKIKINVPVVGRIPNGAIIERESPTVFDESGTIRLLLNRHDFTTSNRMSQAINERMGQGTAFPIDSMSVHVNVPYDISSRVGFISAIENIKVKPGDEKAKIVVNSRTGTIVIGQHVGVSAAAVSHGSLTVTITENQEVSQALPGSENGSTEVIATSEVMTSQPNSRMFLINPGVSLERIVSAINSVGAAPGDIMAILEAISQVGSLNADLEVI